MPDAEGLLGQPVPLLTVSSTLRAGLSALTKTLADQVGPDGVTVNAEVKAVTSL